MLNWSLATEGFSFVVIFVLLLFTHRRTYLPGFRLRGHLLSLYLSLASIALNMLCVYTIEAAAYLPLWLNLALNSLYFFLILLLSTRMALYILQLILEHTYNPRALKLGKRVLAVLIVVFLLLIVWNLQSGVLFYFNSAMEYQRGPLNQVGYAFLLVQLGVVVFCFFRYQSSVSSPVRKLMSIMPPLVVILTLFQYLFPEQLLNGAILAIVHLILYISFQSSSNEVDALTGLGNRNSFYEELTQRTVRKEGFHLVLLSLQRFIQINRRFGHRTGDLFLYEVGAFLSRSAPGAKAFRFGNVEFAVLFPGADPQESQRHFQTVFQRFQQPWKLGEKKSALSACFVEYCHSSPIWGPTQLLENLVHGLRLARQAPDRVVRFDQTVISALQRRAHLLDLLRQSIRERRFQVYYQPVQDLERGGFLTAEALVRLRDLDGTPVPPGEFIPLAEESGMIDKITWIVLEEVCRFLNTPEGQGLESVSVNLSMQQFADPSLAQRIHGIMAGHGVPHRRIKLEITERVLLNDREYMSAMMKEMSAQGFGFYLDDFGTGYSNLSSILDLPFEGIKLDKSIIDTFPANHRAATLVQACVALCHTFGTEIIVEGVETAEQADALARLGADRLQGYFYARPMPGEELAPLLPQGDRL